MASQHYLAGPCEGMCIHRDDTRVWLTDSSEREPFWSVDFDTDAQASSYEWKLRDELYAKYEPIA